MACPGQPGRNGLMNPGPDIRTYIKYVHDGVYDISVSICIGICVCEWFANC